jgi:hypothetical protein
MHNLHFQSGRRFRYLHLKKHYIQTNLAIRHGHLLPHFLQRVSGQRGARVPR